MRKFKIRIGNKYQTIFAEDKSKALEIAKVNLGYKKTDIIMNFTQEFFNGIEDLEKRCQLVKGAIDVVEYWKGETAHIEILRTDGYYDIIKFDSVEKCEEVYNILKVYNRDITPLEKFHASF